MFRVIPLRAANRSLIRFTTINNQVANAHAAAAPPAAAGHHHVEFDRKNVYPRIGNREIVGFGRNGEPSYHDAADVPLPAIRWREDTAELKKLREKARGDWGNLTLDEKIESFELSRVSFYQTVSENFLKRKFLYPMSSSATVWSLILSNLIIS